MRWTTPASACLIAAALIGCNKNRTNGPGETGSMTDTAATAAPAPSDTSGMNRSADTGMHGAGMSDTSHAKSGYGKTGSDTGKAHHDSTAR